MGNVIITTEEVNKMFIYDDYPPILEGISIGDKCKLQVAIE